MVLRTFMIVHTLNHNNRFSRAHVKTKMYNYEPNLKRSASTSHAHTHTQMSSFFSSFYLGNVWHRQGGENEGRGAWGGGWGVGVGGCGRGGGGGKLSVLRAAV